MFYPLSFGNWLAQLIVNMGFFKNLLATTKDKQLAEVKFLLMMVGCDGEITKDEKDCLYEMLKIRNIPLSVFDEVFKLDYTSIPDVFPISLEDRSEMFGELITLMCIDGKCTREEVAFFKYVSKKLGFSSDRVDAMFYNFVQSVDDFGEITKHSLISSYNRYR